MSAARTRVLLADDHALVRQGIRALLEMESDLEVIGEAADGREAVRKAGSLRPDILVMDISMPKLNGIEATLRVGRVSPDTRVIALSIHVGEDYVYALLKAGARGFVLKEAPAADLIAAIRAVRSGDTYLHPRISTSVVAGYLRHGNRQAPVLDKPQTLTSREREVLQLIAEGLTNRRIASELSISVKTVEAHRTRLMSKLKVHNAAGLTRYALSRGLARPE